MISDGFGMTSEAMAREFMRHGNDPTTDWASIMDTMLVGTSRTRSSNSLVTDSGAGATAFSCGSKSYNGGIGITSDKKPCGTVLEAAKAKGYKTGLISTARITHATPAAFAAHVINRDMEDLIALQEIGNNTISHSVDLMFGGGRCQFLPKSHDEGCRSDEVDVWDLAKRAGYTRLASRSTLDSSDPSDISLPVLGLFAHGHMSYEIDRDPKEQPSLTEMTTKALDILDHNSDDGPGFFIMIEGARIDMAGHDNDPATHLRDILQYWETVSAVRKFVDSHPDTTLVSTSDHETGGLTLGIDPMYEWHPEVLAPVKKSAELICSEMKGMASDRLRDHVVNTVLPGYLGIDDAGDGEVMNVLTAASSNSKLCRRMVGQTVSARAHIGWTTGGHTGADVGLYAYGVGASDLRGCYENTQIGAFLAKYLDVKMGSITRSLVNEVTEQRGFSHGSSDNV
ncbi:vacuolar alkaline phosphatase [Linderina macrospora]|uniref:Vacuolar alkaline phosphatase n=1 Tax=Linderina macrospora TaxID=4868 RepID=A0ACC1JHJ7_9FUNG|nr:vacuolar alkaline phosphatase [Linderina macrospora]